VTLAADAAFGVVCLLALPLTLSRVPYAKLGPADTQGAFEPVVPPAQ
jgi:hypothetical protein